MMRRFRVPTFPSLGIPASGELGDASQLSPYSKFQDAEDVSTRQTSTRFNCDERVRPGLFDEDRYADVSTTRSDSSNSDGEHKYQMYQAEGSISKESKVPSVPVEHDNVHWNHTSPMRSEESIVFSPLPCSLGGLSDATIHEVESRELSSLEDFFDNKTVVTRVDTDRHLAHDRPNKEKVSVGRPLRSHSNDRGSQLLETSRRRNMEHEHRKCQYASSHRRDIASNIIVHTEKQSEPSRRMAKNWIRTKPQALLVAIHRHIRPAGAILVRFLVYVVSMFLAFLVVSFAYIRLFVAIQEERRAKMKDNFERPTTADKATATSATNCSFAVPRTHATDSINNGENRNTTQQLQKASLVPSDKANKASNNDDEAISTGPLSTTAIVSPKKSKVPLKNDRDAILTSSTSSNSCIVLDDTLNQSVRPDEKVVPTNLPGCSSIVCDRSNNSEIINDDRTSAMTHKLSGNIMHNASGFSDLSELGSTQTTNKDGNAQQSQDGSHGCSSNEAFETTTCSQKSKWQEQEAETAQSSPKFAVRAPYRNLGHLGERQYPLTDVKYGTFSPEQNPYGATAPFYCPSSEDDILTMRRRTMLHNLSNLPLTSRLENNLLARELGSTALKLAHRHSEPLVTPQGNISPRRAEDRLKISRSPVPDAHRDLYPSKPPQMAASAMRKAVRRYSDVRRSSSVSKIGASRAMGEIKQVKDSIWRALNRNKIQEIRFESPRSASKTLTLVADILVKEYKCLVAVRKNGGLKIRCEKMFPSRQKLRTRVTFHPLGSFSCEIVIARSSEDEFVVSPREYEYFMRDVRHSFESTTSSRSPTS